jgi:hypothetical protein
MRGRTVRVGMMLAAGLLMGAAPPETPPASTEPSSDRPAPFHADGVALERAVHDATAAFLRSDLRSAREALDRIRAGCPPLARDGAPERSNEEMLSDQLLQRTLDLAREFSVSGKTDKAFDQFAWVQRACRMCHELARKAKPAGKIPPPAPDRSGGVSSSSPGGSGSPIRPSESTPWR